MTYDPHQPDEQIDRALQSLRDVNVPTNLEDRVAARLAQAADARTVTAGRSAYTSPFAVIRSFAKGSYSLPAPAPIYALAAAALITAAFFAFHHPPDPNTIAHSNPVPPIAGFLTSEPAGRTASEPAGRTASEPAGHTASEPAGPKASEAAGSTASELRAGGPPYTSVGRSPTYTPTTTIREPEARSIALPTRTQLSTTLTDPDALALAETLAPSRPTPHMPLSPQEHLLLAATRQGQPIEVAELETLRQPATQAAAEARQNAAIRRYAQSLLGPLAAAEAINPTSPSPGDTASLQPPSSK